MPDAKPAEVVIGRATIHLTALLAREMDAVCADLLEELELASLCERQRTTAAHRVVLLCRNLADEIRRYEHLYRLHQREPRDRGQEIEF